MRAPNRLESPLVFLAFFCTLFLFFTPFEQVFGAESRFSEDYLNITRFSGFHVEPGTYANHMGCLLAIMMLVSEFSERLVLLTCVSIFGIFLTNSGSSVYFVPLVTLLGLYLYRAKSVEEKFVGIWLFVLFALTGPTHAARRKAAMPGTVHPGGVAPPRERLP
jgi:hypothetical protein